jgi:hypothetical protein
VVERAYTIHPLPDQGAARRAPPVLTTLLRGTGPHKAAIGGAGVVVVELAEENYLDDTLYASGPRSRPSESGIIFRPIG